SSARFCESIVGRPPSTCKPLSDRPWFSKATSSACPCSASRRRSVARSSRLPPDALQPYLLDVPHPRSPRWRELSSQPRPINWKALFGNDHPVEIEVGFGKGVFLINAGATRPGANFLGIEIERKYVMLSAGRLAKRHIANVRLACTDARW